MFKNMKPLPKAILILLAVGGVGYGVSKALDSGYLSTGKTQQASVPTEMELPSAQAEAASQSNVGSVDITPVTSKETIRVKTIPWNGTAGLHYANGDVTTAPGSLMSKAGLKVQLAREDMYDKMISDMAAFAKDNTTGIHFAIIMGDGYPPFYRGLKEALAPFDQSAAVIGSLGYSRGEDKCVLDAKASPKGSLIGAVLRDGDWNICVKYAADNGILVNPDEKTYDPDAMNFVSVGGFTEADEKFIAGACEDRPVVSNGKRTGETRKVCVNGTATWTPGDVKIARERGNLKVLASTADYIWQMPSIIIGNKQWMDANPKVVENFLAAALNGSEAVRSSDAALLKAGEVQAKVYGEQNAAYWAKYYKGVVEADKTGKEVALGGSTSSGLGDNAFLFGLNGNDNIYKKVYNVFGNIVVKYYPEVMPSLVPYEETVDTKYLQALLGRSNHVAKAETPVFTGKKGEEFARKSYSIEFETGKATFNPAATVTLNELLDQIAISGLTVQIGGHTDNTGDPMKNLELSRKRADSVKSFLMANAPGNFPEERVLSRGYGDTQPTADNSNSAGRAKNRRVEVVLYK